MTPIAVVSFHVPSLQLELYIQQADPERSRTWRVRHCLLRVRHNSDVQALMKGLHPRGGTPTHLAHVETIILETGALVAANTIPPMIAALREGSMAEVRHTTCDEAHKLALQAKKQPSCSTATEFVSPSWCFQRHCGDFW